LPDKTRNAIFAGWDVLGIKFGGHVVVGDAAVCYPAVLLLLLLLVLALLLLKLLLLL
jgi:hypothetical protein